MERAHIGVGEGHHSTTYISFQKLARDLGHSRAGSIWLVIVIPCFIWRVGPLFDIAARYRHAMEPLFPAGRCGDALHTKPELTGGLPSNKSITTLGRLLYMRRYRVSTRELSRENRPRDEKREKFPFWGVPRPLEKALFSQKNGEKYGK